MTLVNHTRIGFSSSEFLAAEKILMSKGGNSQWNQRSAGPWYVQAESTSANQPEADRDAHLVDAEGLAHGGLDVQAAHVLPVLLEQGHQEVDGVADVGADLRVGHAHVGHGHTQAQHLLQLELDGGLGLVHLLLHGLGDGGGELAGLVQTGAQQTGDLLDHGVRGQEGVVGLGQLLHQLLVLVQLLQVLHGARLDLDSLSLLAVLHVTQHAHLHARAGDVRQLHGARETLVLLGVVVLEADLELNGLHELARLRARGLQEVGNSLLEDVVANL
mmetsp:Transcript_16511/g.41197  ORF Transcript_16511/g.41197 Transcript_16511/m.41197 type:complete len:273 (+) Transcript_16511:142-960(+)